MKEVSTAGGNKKAFSEFSQKLKGSVNILEVIGEHVVLRKSGANYVGLCPFHSERSPSFSVHDGKQLYYCYGCHRGGDLITFVMEMQGVSFREALEDLADRARVALPKDWNTHATSAEEKDRDRQAIKEKEALSFKVNRFASAFFHQNLGSWPFAQQYLKQRGASSLVRSFYLGAVGDFWDSLSKHFIEKKAPLDVAQSLGLIRPSTAANRPASSAPYFDLFRNRIIFPIINLRGKVAGFGGRTLGDDQPKYLNSTESSVFQKGKLAFGLYQAQKFIREKNEIILVEGYFDVLALHAAGFQNVVATCGTSLTPAHLHLFKKFADKLVILFDGDKAGQAATERAMEVGLEGGWVIYGAKMPPSLDPDQLVIDSATGEVSPIGTAKMSEILAQATPILDSMILEELKTANSDNESRTQALKKIGSWLSQLEDPVGRSLRMEHVQQKLGISKDLLVKVLRGNAPLPRKDGSPESGGILRPVSKVQKGASNLSKNIQKFTSLERTLLVGIAVGKEYTQLLMRAKGDLPPKMELWDLFEYPPARQLVANLFLKSQENDPQSLQIDSEVLHDSSLDPQLRSLLSEALMGDVPLVSTQEFKGALIRSTAKKWAQFSQQMKTALAKAESSKDADLQGRLMKEYLDVQRKMKELNSFYDEE